MFSLGPPSLLPLAFTGLLFTHGLVLFISLDLSAETLPHKSVLGYSCECSVPQNHCFPSKVTAFRLPPVVDLVFRKLKLAYP